MEEGRSREITIDMELLEYSSLKQKIEAKDPLMSPNCCIFKTPKTLLRHNAKAFLPNAFSIEPFHHGKKHLKATEKIKYKYMKSLVDRSQKPLSAFTEVIEKIEKDARDCYDRPIVFSKKDFVEMLVVDGCFIIELFRRDNKKELRDKDDPIFTTSFLRPCLDHDLILLENQIPWKVLEHLFQLMGHEIKHLHQLAIVFFRDLFSYHSHSDQTSSLKFLEEMKFHEHESKHILDLLRNWLVLSSKEERRNQTPGSGQGNNNNQPAGPRGIWQGFPSATILKEAGVKFKKDCILDWLVCSSKEEGSNQSSTPWQRFPSATKLNEAGVKFIKVTSDHSILDVQFTSKKGTLAIPTLLIHGNTEVIFRNLISLEQCTPNYPPIICSYIVFMDNLINITKDIEILCENKIIENYLDPEKATQFFNNLYEDTFVKNFYYHGLCNQVNQYCERSWPKWRANLLHNYFNSPWAIIGLTFGASLWVLTFLQTYFTIRG